jgi:UDP-glucuronate decarboxylase
MNHNTIVTGGCGFLGSHLVEACLNEGDRVWVVDNFVTGDRDNLSAALANPAWADRLTIIEANAATDPATYLPADLDHVDRVFHMASPASPPRYQAEPILTYLVNSYGTHLWLSWLKAHYPTARFLFASTSEVYGDPAVHPQTESYWGNVNPNGPRSCYDEAKRLGESICGVFSRDMGMDVRIVRIFNTYGPRMDPNDGRIMPALIGQALRNEPLTVFGDGSQTRSYCYVSDLVGGLMAFMASAEAAGKTVNIGNPDEYSVLQTAQIIFEKINGRPAAAADIVFRPLPQDDPTRRRPDISLAQNLLFWQPTVTLTDGLVSTIEYFRHHQS